MTASQLRDWQRRLGYTNAEAAFELGMSLSGYAQLRAGVHRTTGRVMAIEKRTVLACLAMEMLAERAVKHELKVMSLIRDGKRVAPSKPFVANSQKSCSQLSHAMLRELPKIAHEGADSAHLQDMVAKHPEIAVRVADAIDQTIFEMEDMENPWVLLHELTLAYEKEAHVLRSMIARKTANDLLKDIEKELHDK